MRMIARLDDQLLMGQSGLSQAAPRYTARGLVCNSRGEIAVMYAAKFDLYTLPGGGLEENETPEEAFRREVREETGCALGQVWELGEVHENRAQADYTQINYYFVAETEAVDQHMELTPDEAANGTRVEWHSLERAMQLITEPVHDNYQRRYLQARDAAALCAYKEQTI